jgi:hypothetical protein
MVTRRRAEEAAVADKKMGHRVPWPRAAADGPRETLPQRTPGATGTGWPEPAGRPPASGQDGFPEFALPEYIRTDGPELAGETERPPTHEVLDRVLDALRKLS